MILENFDLTKIEKFYMKLNEKRNIKYKTILLILINKNSPRALKKNQLKICYNFDFCFQMRCIWLQVLHTQQFPE